jgi:hypothetical protein
LSLSGQADSEKCNSAIRSLVPKIHLIFPGAVIELRRMQRSAVARGELHAGYSGRRSG